MSFSIMKNYTKRNIAFPLLTNVGLRVGERVGFKVGYPSAFHPSAVERTET